MGLAAENKDDASARLIAAGRALLAGGDARFSLTKLCGEAGVTLEEFRASFASKAALLQQLMEPAPVEKAEAPQADPWLERRLRVFERALGALEEKSEKRDREYRQTIAYLEERLAALSGTRLKLDVAAAAKQVGEPAAEPVAEAPAADAADFAPDALEEAIRDAVAGPDPLALAPLEPMGPPGRADADFLEAGRRAALAHARTLEEPPKRGRRISTRFLMVSVLALMTLLLCAVVTFGHNGNARAASAESTAHRATALTPLEKLMARADSGDAAAERDLAFAYLRGTGVAKDVAAAARWAEAAAQQDDAQAQYLAGSFYRDGAGVARDTTKAFTWFARAAASGQPKAMHNLAIAYIQGDGTAKDDAEAAAWFGRAAQAGYVDSAFDLAVLYEKGQGVAQDARLALRWYRAAAAAGDVQASARAQLLARQAHLQNASL